MEQIRLQRQALYEQVWTEPMTSLGKRYGISDVGLRKVCKKLHIPLPKVGHWQKKAVGRCPPQPDLPPLSAGEPDHVVLSPDADHRSGKTKPSELLAAAAAVGEIQCPIELRQPHSLVEATSFAFKSAKPDQYQLVSPIGENVLDVYIAPNSLPRTLLIIDTLLKALESRGYKVTAAREYRDGTKVAIGTEQISFRIREGCRRIQRVLTHVEKMKLKIDPHMYISDQYSYAPTGVLSFNIEAWLAPRERWSDGKTARIENRLAEIVATMEATAELRKQRRIKEEEDRKREEQRERRRRIEEQRVRDFDERFGEWVTLQNRRAFIEAVKRHAIAEQGQIVPGSDLDKWLQWAARHVDDADLLTPKFAVRDW